MPKVPKVIHSELLEKVITLADREGCLTNTRPQNKAFMDRLASDPQIGGILAEFMADEEVRVYIKDSLLNKYSKIKRKKTKGEIQELVKDYVKEEISPIEIKGDIFLYRKCSTGQCLIVAKGTFQKWETAIRKVLLYIAGRPLLTKEAGIQKLILLTTAGVPLCIGEEDLLRKALKAIGFEVLVV